ncbi:sugar ABC transporter permease [Lederbergia sp. NSJ-179]|uniref:carbohydrate ABC transporter permease n=1 Tax=Lederbergia sp. NSJ-179 TaxID=2931402 RepID=UPI001FD27A26|nr:sugar ABC transporter permease [Lederbergia sp. NSJ-179]MCJ7841549.1 sugar ABC transporter permease [Lederbergia sp. NSJ-179]
MHDSIFIKSLFNTLYFVFIGTPFVIAFQLATALILNIEVKGINIFRTLYYLPYLVPMVASVIIWIIIFGHTGVVNQILGLVGLGPFDWIQNVHLIKPVIIAMGMWAAGSGILIFLAGLKGVPTHLYEVAKIDGAGPIKRFIHVTLPMITPTILFSVVMQSIAYFQMFTESYILNKGGPDYASTTYLVNTYNTAFRDFDFGLAMAQSWILFIIILIITLIVMRSSKSWVYYEAGNGR